MQTKEFPTLYGLSSTGKPKEWKIRVITLPGSNGSENPIIEITHGYVDGKKVTSSRRVESGKNIGKTNETTAFEQACLEAQSLWTSKRDQKYIETIPTEDTKSDIILPMLAQKFKDRKHEIKYPCFAQPKLNGVRCLAQKLDGSVKYISRGGKEFTTLSHMTSYILNALQEDGEILDGEIFVKGWSFQEIIRNVKKQRDTSSQLQYWVYDKADPNLAFIDRSQWLEWNVGRLYPSIVLVDTLVVEKESDVYKLHKEFVSQGFEGIIIRNAGGRYIFDHRSKDLQKYKTFEDKEFKIIGGYEGEGLEEGCVVFVCDLGNGKEFHVRPRGSRDLRREWLKDLKNIVGKDLTVRYQDLSEDGVPTFGVGITIRDYE
jgi:DNA ligase-1